MKKKMLFLCMLGFIITSEISANNPPLGLALIGRPQKEQSHVIDMPPDLADSAQLEHKAHEPSKCVQAFGCLAFGTVATILAVYVHLY